MSERRKYVDGIRIWRRRALEDGGWRYDGWQYTGELSVEQKSKHSKIVNMFVSRSHPHLLVAAGFDGNIRVWDIHKRVVVTTIREQSERVRRHAHTHSQSIAFSMPTQSCRSRSIQIYPTAHPITRVRMCVQSSSSVSESV
ncbi:unnamed protein product [Sphagnum balticum]